MSERVEISCSCSTCSAQNVSSMWQVRAQAGHRTSWHPKYLASLLCRVELMVALYWCRRGCQGERELRRGSFDFHKDADGREFVSMRHQGGIADKQSQEKQTRLYSTGQYKCVHMRSPSKQFSFLTEIQCNIFNPAVITVRFWGTVNYRRIVH